MQRVLNSVEVQRIGEFNTKLIVIEEKIYHLAEKEYKIAEERVHKNPDENIIDSELNVEILFSTSKEKDEDGDDKELAYWDESVYFARFPDEPFGINDKQCHNVTSGLIDNKALNVQKHCWLLHRLYDDFDVSWEDILRIDEIHFDIKVSYQYKIKLEEVKI